MTGTIPRKAAETAPAQVSPNPASAEGAVADSAADPFWFADSPPPDGGESLPSGLRSKFEQSLGADLGGVRVHTGERSATSAASLGARAYAVGQDVHFARGSYNPTSRAGEELLAHEVAHTVQQGPGTSAGPQTKLAVSSPGDALESEADTAASAMVAGRPAIVTRSASSARNVIALKSGDGDKDDEKGDDKKGDEKKKDSPPDEETLFGDGDAWGEVRDVERETREKAQHETAPETLNHWPSLVPRMWRPLNWAYGKLKGTESSESLLVQWAQMWLRQKLEEMLNTTVTIRGLKVDLHVGLISVTAIEIGPARQILGGLDVLLAGGTLNGLELQFTKADLWNAYRGNKMSEGLTLRFTSLRLPQVKLGKSSESKPKPKTETSTLPARVRALLDSLRVGFHVDQVDFDLMAQDGDDMTFGLALHRGAVRVQLGQSFWSAWGAVRGTPSPSPSPSTPEPEPPQRVEFDFNGRQHTVDSLRSSVIGACNDMYYDPVQMAEFLRPTHLPRLRELYQDKRLSDDEREMIEELIEFIEGDPEGLELRTQRRRAKERDDTKKNVESLGAPKQREHNTVSLHGVHGAVVGREHSKEGHTSGRLHVDGIETHDLDVNVPGLGVKVGSGTVGPLDVRLLQNQLGMQLDQAKVQNVNVDTGTQSGSVKSLELGRTRAGARVGDLAQPTGDVDGVVHVGPISGHGIEGTQGERRVGVKDLLTGTTNASMHQHGDRRELDVDGMALNVGGLTGQTNPDTRVQIESLRTTPSTVHVEQHGKTTDGSVTSGEVTVDKAQVDGKNLHGQVERAHVDQVSGSLTGDQGAGRVDGLSLSHIEARQGEHRIDVGSVGLDTLVADGDRKTHTGVVSTGTLDVKDLHGHTGGGTSEIDGTVGSLQVGPTRGQLGNDRAQLVNESLTMRKLEATRGDTQVGLRKLETRGLQGGYDGAKESEVTGGVDRLTVDKAKMTQRGTGATSTLGSGRVDGLGVALGSDGNVTAGLRGAQVSKAETSTSRTIGDGDRKNRENDWLEKDQHAQLGHLSVGSFGVGDGEKKGHTTVSVKDVDVQGVDYEWSEGGDRESRKISQAQLLYDDAILKAQQLYEIDVRTAKARSLAKSEKKREAWLKKKLEEAQVAYDKRLKEAKESLAKVTAKREKKKDKKEEKKSSPKSKVRGGHTHVDGLHLDGVSTDLTGVEDGAPQVESVGLGGVGGTHVSQSKTFDDVDSMIVDVEQVSLQLDAHQTGRVVVRIKMGSRMLENVLGKTTGKLVDGVSKMDDNGLTLSIDVVNGALSLDSMTTAFDKDSLATKIVKKWLKGVHIGGGKVKKDLGGQKEMPHLSLPFLGNREVEQLGLGKLHDEQKPVLLTSGKRGGVNLKNLLESGLQSMIDGAVGDAPKKPEPGSLGMHSVDSFQTSGLEVNDVDMHKHSGARPGESLVDESGVSIGSAKVGETRGELDQVALVKAVVEKIAGMIGGKPSESKPPESKPPESKPPESKPPPSSNALDGLFKLLETLMSSSPSSGQTTGQSSGSSEPHRSRNQRFRHDGHHLDVFNTRGRGDCGIHAMFGVPQPGTGTVAAPNPRTQRKQLARALNGHDPVGHGLVDQAAYTQLLIDLLLPILSGRGNEDERAAFLQVDGFLDDAMEAKRQDDQQYAVHGGHVDAFIDHLIDTYVHVLDSPIGAAIRDHLIDVLLHSDSPNDVLLRKQLVEAPGRRERHLLLVQAPKVHLRRVIGTDVDVVVVVATSAGAPQGIGDGHLQLQQQHAQLGTHLRNLVTRHFLQLLAAYAKVVRQDGYYLHSEDLHLLARLNNLDLHIYREHDQLPGHFAEEPNPHPVLGGRRVDIFHDHEHYEQSHWA